LRANWSRECVPGDRLREAIQQAAKREAARLDRVVAALIADTGVALRLKPD